MSEEVPVHRETATQMAPSMNLSRLFQGSAATYPDNIAVIFCQEDGCEERVTYRELQCQARRVSDELERWCTGSSPSTQNIGSMSYTSHAQQNYVYNTAQTCNLHHGKDDDKQSCSQNQEQDQSPVKNQDQCHNQIQTQSSTNEDQKQCVSQSEKEGHCKNQNNDLDQYPSDSMTPRSDTVMEDRLGSDIRLENRLVSNTGMEDKIESVLPAIIGILCSSGIEAIAAILACLENNSYWYISPEYTRREIKVLCGKICPKMILVQEEYLDKVADLYVLKTLASIQILNNSFKLVSFDPEKESSFLRQSSVKNLAYVIPTSGTTGDPKCVYVPHTSIFPNIMDLVSRFTIGPEDCIFAAAPLTFDPSVVDMFMAFKARARLLVPSRSLLRMPKYLVSTMAKVGVTVLQATPTLLFSIGKERLQQSLFSSSSCLRVLALGGEMFPRRFNLNTFIGETHHVTIFNLYGITEVSCWASVQVTTCVNESIAERNGSVFNVSGKYANCEENYTEADIRKRCSLADSVGDMTSVGSPLTSTEVLVLRENGSKVEELEVGEIFVGGQERHCWVDDSTSSIANNQPYLRSTGDQGVILNGCIYCLGRKDGSQVKRNGQKVSLEEIAGVLRNTEYVTSCHVTFNLNKIIAFVLPLRRKMTPTKEVLWEYLKMHLSSGKLPDDVVLVEQMPFNIHGKIDEKQLILQHAHLSKQKCVNFESFEVSFKELWMQTLGCQFINPGDKFIVSGGNSLDALQFTNDFELLMDCKIPNLLDVLLNESYYSALQLVRQVYYAKRKLENPDNSNVKSKMAKPSIKHENQHCHQPQGRDLHIETSKQHDLSEGIGLQEIVKHDPEKQITTVSMVVSRRGVYGTGGPGGLLHKPSAHERDPLWRYDLGKCIDSSPTVVEFGDGSVVVMVGSHSHKFCCVEGASGALRWVVTLGDRVESSPAVSPGGTQVYVGCYDGKLYCIMVSDGTVLWEYETVDKGEVKSSPVVDWKTGCVIFGAHDKILHCVTEKGALKWAVQISEGSVFSSPCLGDDSVFVATLDGTVASVEKESGQILWKVNVGSPVFSSLASCSDGVIVGAVSGQVLCYSFSGTRLWEFKTERSVFSSPFVLRLGDEEEVISIGSHDHHTYFLNGKGEPIVTFAASSPVYATPFLCALNDAKGFRALICETSGTVYIVNVALENISAFIQGGSNVKEEGNKSLNINTDINNIAAEASLAVEWKHKLGGEIFASPVCHGGRVYVGCRDDYLYCFDFN